jgi:hypothetical protein
MLEITREKEPEETTRYGYIYKTTIPPTSSTPYERFYIGLHRAEEFSEDYFGSGKKILDFAQKYGLKKNKWRICPLKAKEFGLKVELLAWASSKEELDKLEHDFIEPHLNTKECFNLRSGGMTPGHSLEMRKHMSEAALNPITR